MAHNTDKNKIKKYLKDHGHTSDKVDKKTFSDAEQTRKDLCDLHLITREEYSRTGV